MAVEGNPVVTIVMLSFCVGDFGNAAFGKLVDPRVRIRQQDRRMRGDDQLRLMMNQPVQQRQHAQLALRRERRFRFVQQIDAVPLEPMLQQRQKRTPRAIAHATNRPP